MNKIEIFLIVRDVILWILNAYTIGMVIYFFMSWIPGLRESIVGHWMSKIYEPFLEPFRRVIPPIGVFDISSIAALIFLQFLMRGLIAIFNALLPYFI